MKNKYNFKKIKSATKPECHQNENPVSGMGSGGIHKPPGDSIMHPESCQESRVFRMCLLFWDPNPISNR
jgi:hypothetical protein